MAKEKIYSLKFIQSKGFLKAVQKREEKEAWAREKVRRKMMTKFTPKELLDYLNKQKELDLLKQDFRRK